MSYDLIIAATFIVAYIFSYNFYRRGIIRKIVHIRIWNLILLLAFLLTVSMGLLLAGIADFGLIVPLDPNFNILHMEIGLVFFIIMIFHLSSNWGHFKKLFSSSKERYVNKT